MGFEKAFREKARLAVLEQLPPDQLLWRSDSETEADLFGHNRRDLRKSKGSVPEDSISVPKAYIELMKAVLCHSDPERFHLLYHALWRLQAERHLLQDRSSRLISRLQNMAKSVRRDCHKMTAFVRFREISNAQTGPRAFHAWFEPDHWIIERAGPFFANRFGDMDWIIETPKGCAQLHDGALSFSKDVPQPHVPEDETGELWNTYYLNIFNPARLKVKAMQSEMPKKYWRNMPETALIPEMIATAQSRSEAMQREAATQPPFRAERLRSMMQQREELENAKANQQIAAGGLDDLKLRASGCTRCPLHCNATQTVFGEGPADAELMLVGEQPGDREDLAGRPFVGPAGQLLDRLMQEAGIDRERAYLTNAVKHFKFEPRGKRRIHKNPSKAEITHCKWWLEAERAVIRPKAIVALGGSAALALTGRGDGILKRRGTVERLPDGTPVLITFHPSAILRMTGAASQTAQQDMLSDLRSALRVLTAPASA
ncbi:UdgX family uracil-DNA binding protein [Pararhizobium sp. IMCC21322]|uniref:UdgX family uracil-DNA binding protein n=1 Tax=Pararhizobium sp. IMCC21322 TaxID=3067903 RepID=UPI00353197BC